MHSTDQDDFQVHFRSATGFEFEDAPNGFVIWTTLIEGYIKQSLNDNEPAFGIKVVIFDAEAESGEGEVIQTVSTDKNGRY